MKAFRAQATPPIGYRGLQFSAGALALAAAATPPSFAGMPAPQQLDAVGGEQPRGLPPLAPPSSSRKAPRGAPTPRPEGAPPPLMDVHVARRRAGGPFR